MGQLSITVTLNLGLPHTVSKCIGLDFIPQSNVIMETDRYTGMLGGCKRQFIGQALVEEFMR